MPLDMIEKTRELLKINSKRKFDLVPDLLSHDAMMNKKTTRLIWELVDMLQINEREFPVIQFRLFVTNYRNKIRKKRKEIAADSYSELPERKTIQKKNEGTNTNDDWRNFQPTDPDTLKKTGTEPLLAKVIPDKKI